MEAVFVLLVIISVIVRIAAASKKQQEQQAQKAATPDPKGAEDRRSSGERSYGGVNRPNANGYRQEKTVPERKASTKGAFVSTEGSESNEGKCIEPDANHCAVEHDADSVYLTEITDEPASAFTREDMVKGIIMAEILSKPKCME